MSERDPLRYLEAELCELERAGLLRTPETGERPAGLIVLCSNDYLGYAAELEGMTADYGFPSGAGASRLVVGEHPAHVEAERAIASWLGLESALLFSSGYAANVGAIAALAAPGDVIVSDALNHASIIDGCRLSGAAIHIVPHRDSGAVESALRQARDARHRWVVTESYFSMDGDTPDLIALRHLADAADAALVVDEAHALGVFGPCGAGLCAEVGVKPDVLVGTAGKALGLQGAFVAGSHRLRAWLWNRARSFVFSTGVSPRLASMIRERVLRVCGDDSRRSQLHVVSAALRTGLTALGVPTGATRGPILPWLVGDAGQAASFSKRLAQAGVLVQAIRPPTVPEGRARLRVTGNALLSTAQVQRVLAAFAACRPCFT